MSDYLLLCRLSVQKRHWSNWFCPPIVWGFLMLSTLSLLLPGCSLTQPAPAVQHYVLRPTVPEEIPQSALHNRHTLLVRAFTAREPYDQQRLVYRSSPYQLDFYTYHRWAASPAEQITDWTRQYLRRTGLFAKVFPTAKGSADMIDMVLGGTIRHLEEIDHDQTWQAALSIDIWLTRPPQRTPFWFASYSATRQAAKRNPAAIAEAMSRNLETILQQLTTDLMPVVGGE
jgi:cholesterol transport system auxiliary component